MHKIGKGGIIGAGHVGSHVAAMLASQGVCGQIALLDIDQKKALAHSQDIADGMAYWPRPVRVWAGDYQDLADADLVVMAACGAAIEQNRLDELAATVAVMDQIVPQLKACGFGGVVVSISNPCDVIAQYLQKALGLTVIGTGTALDSARLSRRLAGLLGAAPQSVSAYMLGEHGDSQVPAFHAASVAGQPLAQWMAEHPGRCAAEELARVARETAEAGWEIVLGKGSTEFGVASAAAALIRAVLLDEKRVLPCSVPLDGQYGQRDVYASTLCLIGAGGAEEIWQLPLSDQEAQALAESCRIIREYGVKAAALSTLANEKIHG